MGLGALADKPLTEVRDEAAMLRVLVKCGGDPIVEKRTGARGPRMARSRSAVLHHRRRPSWRQPRLCISIKPGPLNGGGPAAVLGYHIRIRS